MRCRHAGLCIFVVLIGHCCLAFGQVQVPSTFKGINVAAIEFSRDGKWLAAVGTVPHKSGTQQDIPMSGLIKVWEVASGKVIFDHVEEQWEASSLSFSPTAPLLAVGFNDRPRARVVVEKDTITLIYDENMPPVPVKVWNVKSSKEHRCFLHSDNKANTDNIKSVGFSADGSLLATTNANVPIWNVDRNEKRLPISEDNSSFGALIAFSGKDKNIAATAMFSTDPGNQFECSTLFAVWDIDARKRIAKESFPDLIRALAFSSDGSFVAIAGGDKNTVRVYNVEKRKVFNSFHVQLAHIASVAFSPDSKTVYVSGNDLTKGKAKSAWRAFDRATGELIHSQETELGMANALAVSPDGQWLATGGLGSVTLWNLNLSLKRQRR